MAQGSVVGRGPVPGPLAVAGGRGGVRDAAFSFSSSFGDAVDIAAVVGGEETIVLSASLSSSSLARMRPRLSSTP